MSRRILVIPAAGLGSRLGAELPKLLVPVGGVPMVDRLRDLYVHVVEQIVLIVHPAFEQAVRRHVSRWTVPVSLAVQVTRTGMLDAVMLGGHAVRASGCDSVWITWCDQVVVHPLTVRRLAATALAHPEAKMVMPTVQRARPYIHLRRDGQGRILEILHRREGDAMPDIGESDMGLFALSASAYLDELPRYAAQCTVGRATGERNFLPFIPWVDARQPVVTFPSVDESEAVGVNTPAELALAERLLAERGGTAV